MNATWMDFDGRIAYGHFDTRAGIGTLFDAEERISTRVKLEKPVNGVFQDRSVPAGTRLAGLAALSHELAIAAPVRWPSAVSEQYVSGSRRQVDGWAIFDKRYLAGRQLHRGQLRRVR